MAKFFGLARDERVLLARALVLVLQVRIALWLIPLSRLHAHLVSRPVKPGVVTAQLAHRLSWSVSTTANRVPGATCLTRALALQALLRAKGGSSRIHVGFLRQGTGMVHGHAWLEWQGQVLMGGGELSRFEVLMALDG